MTWSVRIGKAGGEYRGGGVYAVHRDRISVSIVLDRSAYNYMHVSYRRDD